MTKKINKYIYIFLVSLIPISIIIGSAISLINILLISTTAIFLIILSKKRYFFKNIEILIFIILFIYLLFNTYISIDYNYSLTRNFGFLRFILFFIAINYFFYKIKDFDKFFTFWIIVIFTIIFDSYIEFIFGQNLLGFGDEKHVYIDRIVSFFKDEPIVGGFLNGFFFLILGYLFKYNYFKKYNYLICFIVVSLFLICIFITGERSNTIKAVIGLSIFFILNKEFKFKHKIFLMISFFIIAFLLISSSSYLKNRYIDNIISPILKADTREKFLEDNIYFKHYRSGYAVFKNYPIFGVGNKNYRIETRNNQFTKEKYIPDTHPHQVYFEFLSEHGIIGTFILLSSFLFLIFKNIKICLISKNYLQLGAFAFLITNFLPIVPSGSFFSDFNITIFFINLSIYYACNPNSNIFKERLSY